MRQLDDPALRNLVLAMMAKDVETSAPLVRELADEPGTRGFALCWLVDHGLVEPDELFDPDDAATFVDILANRLVTGGPAGLTGTLARAGDVDQQIAVIEKIWRAPSTATESVLGAVGSVHDDKRVAKAARKAQFKRRSWDGGAGKR